MCVFWALINQLWSILQEQYLFQPTACKYDRWSQLFVLINKQPKLQLLRQLLNTLEHNLQYCYLSQLKKNIQAIKKQPQHSIQLRHLCSCQMVMIMFCVTNPASKYAGVVFMIININLMKGFSTFAGNSPISSSYYSPKSNSPKFIFPPNTDSRGLNIQPPRNNFEREEFERHPSIDVTKGQQQHMIEEVEQEDKDSRISLLLSQVSVPAPQRPQFDAKRLFNLQNKITQNILELRQQKISLMQELSKTIDIKNLHEYYLNQISKQRDERQTAYGSRIEKSKSPRAKNNEEEIVPTHISAQILRKNQELHLRLKELQIKEEIFGPNLKSNEDQAQNAQIMDEIMRFKELNIKLKAEIAQKIKNNSNGTSNSDSRFVTFLPQDREKHIKNRNIKGELQELKQKYAKLLAQSKEPVFKLTEQQNAYIQELRRQNQQLQKQAEEILRKKEGSRLNQLRERLEQNEHEKSIFLGELQKFKNTMRQLKQQNEALKKELSR